MELRDLTCFLAIVRHEHFGRAAEELGIAQPPLSRRIARLEREIGTLLFSRLRRRIAPTEAGRAFAREARVVLEQATLAAEVARAAARGAVGHLRLGYVGSSGYRIVPNAIRSFRVRRPAALVTMRELLGARQIEAIRTGSIDVALIRGPAEIAGLTGVRLRGDRLGVALPFSHPLADAKTVAVEALADEPFVAFNRYGATGLHDLVRGVCAAAGFVPRVVQEVETIDALAAAVAAGIGVALIYDVVATLPIEGIVHRSIRPAAPIVDLTAFRRTDDRDPLVPVFIEELRRAARG